MGIKLSALTSAASANATDIFHLRTTGGIDKKITKTNLFASDLALDGSNTYAGTNTFNDVITFASSIVFSCAVSGTVSGVATFTGNLIFSGDPTFSGDPNFTGNPKWITSDGTSFRIKKLLSGTWNMHTTPTKTIPHGLSLNNIVGVCKIQVMNDAQDEIVPFIIGSPYETTLCGSYSIDATNIYLNVEDFFDTSFSYVGTSVNRATVFLLYVV
jgi:hypothetical protein